MVRKLVAGVSISFIVEWGWSSSMMQTLVSSKTKSVDDLAPKTKSVYSTMHRQPIVCVLHNAPTTNCLRIP